MNQLQQLVINRMDELGIQAREAARRSKAGGRLGVSYETIRNIVQGRHGGKVGDRIAEGLAVALDLPLSRIYEATQTPQPVSSWEWPKRFDRLSLPQRELVEDVAAALLAAYERGLRDAG